MTATRPPRAVNNSDELSEGLRAGPPVLNEGLRAGLGASVEGTEPKRAEAARTNAVQAAVVAEPAAISSVSLLPGTSLRATWTPSCPPPCPPP